MRCLSFKKEGRDLDDRALPVCGCRYYYCLAGGFFT